MRRRDFLRLSLAGVAGLGAAACARSIRLPSGVPLTLEGLVRRLETDGATHGLQVFPGGLEYVAGRRQRLTLGLVDPAGVTIEGGTAGVHLVTSGEALSAPHEARYRSYRRTVLADDPRGFHAADVAIPGPGLVDVLASIEHEERTLYGWTTIESRADAIPPDLGERALAVPTPTVEDLRGVANLCTREPEPCPLHDRTLAAVLGDGVPVVFTISSPLLCTSRTCGPVLEEVLAVHTHRGDRARFVHAEPYAGDTSTTLAPVAETWRIPSEPWTFVIDGDGIVRARFEGPVIADEIDAALRALP